jgi:hypothetical protein
MESIDPLMGDGPARKKEPKPWLPQEEYEQLRASEKAWVQLDEAMRTIQACADQLKHSETKMPDGRFLSLAGYEMEKALNKHKSVLVTAHLMNLREFIAKWGNQ